MIFGSRLVTRDIEIRTKCPIPRVISILKIKIYHDARGSKIKTCANILFIFLSLSHALIENIYSYP
jgi:hypothetical protein